MGTEGLSQERYQIVRQLGKKAGRQTLLAQDLQSQALVVIKRLSFSNDVSWDDLKLFEREAETLRSLSHPALPSYLDWFEFSTANSKGFAFVQNYIEALSLEEHLHNGRTFDETEVKQLIRSVLDILIYLHDRQPPVIHRDIKPSNILLGDRSGNSPGQVYLVDFGSVQTLASREGKTMTVVGTYGYMPPEQFGGVAHPASDLYSLGATAIALLTRTHPADLPQADLQLQFESAADISPAFTQWLHCITHPSLDRRFSSARKALDAIADPLWQQHAIRPNAASSQILSPPPIFGMALGRSTLLGMLTGAVYGGLFGTGILPRGGTLLVAGIGGIWGIGLGLVNGLLIGLLTERFFTCFKHPRRARRILNTVSFLFSVSINLAALWWLTTSNTPEQWNAFLNALPLFAPAIAIASASMVLTTQSITRWYEHESQK